MRRTVDKIARGCGSATNPVEREKNSLFAQALAHLHSCQDALQFLDICSSISQLRNKKRALDYKTHLDTIIKAAQSDGCQPDQQTSNTIVNIYNQLYPNNDADVCDILSTIEQWAFRHQTSFCVDEVPDVSVLSLVDDGPRKSFIETQATAFETLFPTTRDRRQMHSETVRTFEPARRGPYMSPYVPSPKRCPVPVIDFAF